MLQGGKQLPYYSWEILLSLILFAAVAGARYHTGYDHAMYLEQYVLLQKTGNFSRHNFEYGFECISRLFAWCNIHYFFYFAFWALLQIGFLYYGLRNHKHLLCWIGLGIMCGSYFLGWMNSVRQSVVVCMFVVLIPLIKDRKFIPYALIVVVAAFIHKSVLLVLPFFLISFLKIDTKMPNKWIMMTIFIVFVLLGTFLPILFNYNEIISNGENKWLLDITGYSNYGNLNDPNVGNRWKGLVTWGPSRISMFFGSLAFIWLFPEINEYFKSDKLLPYFYVLAFFGICVYFLLMNTTHFILRPTDYFLIFYLIMGAYVMEYLTKSPRKKCLTIAISLLLYTHFIVDVYKGAYRPTDTTRPFIYHTFLLPTI